ncbi:hypothetical protein AcW1_009022 [Taiwanofungus camphoratus]|nr:hypothetical protein AcW1_009022 [Antrodia cinnamomea]
MPKRPLASTSSISPKKKVKAVTDQYSLDKFFKSRSPPSSGSVVGSSKNAIQTGEGQNAQCAVRQDSCDIVAADEAYAWAIAQGDGLDLETLQRLEETTHQKALPALSTLKPVPSNSEVIDVDLLDDQLLQAGPSKLPSNDVSASQYEDRRASYSALLASFQSIPPNNNSASSAGLTYLTLAIDPVQYVPDTNAWPVDTPVPYSFVAHTLASLSETRSRIAILNILTNSLRTITKHHPPSLLPALYLLSNSLSPPYSPIELGLGPSIISKAIQHVSGLTSSALRRLYNRTGDAGDVAFEAKSNVRTLIPHPPLLIVGVYESLLKIARTKEQGATKQKQTIVERLLVASKGEETRFLVRTLAQNLRVGAVRTSLLTALARAVVFTPPPTVTMLVPPDSHLHVTSEYLQQLKPLPLHGKKVVDSARDELNEVLANAESLMRRIYVQHPNYDHIVEALLEADLDGLRDRLPLTVGVPLLPTLGSPTRSLDEIYDRLGLLPFSAEFKYDGQRAQIHAMKMDTRTSTKIFSRHLEDMTDKYPDVVSLVQDITQASPQTESFIIDAEIVAIDPANGSIKSFQELSNRARKDVRLDDVKVSVCIYAFDIMYLDGQVLLEKPFRERRHLLHSRFPPYMPQSRGAARFDHVQSCESEDGREVVEAFWQKALNSSCEGLMVKLLDSGDVLEELNQKGTRRKPLPATYEPDKRTSAWLKLKKDYVTGLSDSLDLVPVGAWHGNGRKAQWWSPILLAVWEPDTGRLVAVCKCMSGFSDAFYKDLKERYPEDSDTCSRQPLWEPACVTGGLKPEVYFKPQEVWEIRGADITLSPVSVASLGLVSQSRGLSLRFPRFIKVREDKGIDNASTPEFLAKIWHNQQAGKDQSSADDGELVDVSMEEDDIGQSDHED